MPTSANNEYPESIPLPEGLDANSEVFYQPITNEVFKDYEEFFDRMIQLNSSCWVCNITGKGGLTYEEAVQSEEEAIDQINNFPLFLETPILFLVHRFTCRARVNELVDDVFTFMRDRYFVDEEVVYKHTMHKRLEARVISVNYHPAMSNGEPPGPSKSPMKSPAKKDTDSSMELCRPECFSYNLQILHGNGSDSSSEAESSSDDNEEGGQRAKLPTQVNNIPFTQIGRGKGSYATQKRIKLFIRYYTEMTPEGRLAVKPNVVVDFRLNQIRWDQLFADCPEPKFPQTRAGKKSKLERLSSISISNEVKKSKALDHYFTQPSTSKQQNNKHATAKGGSSTAGVKKAEIRRKQILEQQSQLEPLFKQADRAGVENVDRWRQTFMILTNEDIEGLRTAIVEAKEAEKRRQIEKRKREKEAQIEWKKPRDDLLCDDLKTFPQFKALRWPDWIPREHYWDILSIHNFFLNFAEVLFSDRQNPFRLVDVATAIVSKQISEKSHFFQTLDWLMTAMDKCLTEDEGNPADLKHPDIGNEQNKDFDHPVHGERIRRINLECDRQKKIHGTHIRKFNRNHLDITEIVRLHLKTSGFYTQYRRQLRGQMRCYEDDGYQFVRSEQEIMKILKKSSVYALNPEQRIKLLDVLMNQLLSHCRFRQLIEKRTEQLGELKKVLRHLKAVDSQHDREAREAQQHFQQNGAAHQQNGIDPNSKETKAQLKELAGLRRALENLNGGRRVQNITEIRDRLVDEQTPLPWLLMESAKEVQEFRAAQHNFHNDKLLEVLREIYELQGKMGLYFLGRDRAFRSYYYICSTFLIYCPPNDELGECGEPTPNLHKLEQQTVEMTKVEAKAEEKDDEIEIIEPNEKEKQENEAEQREKEELEQSPGSRLMACTGEMNSCPVHNPPRDSPRIFYFMGRVAVKELLDALNPRGFRESELADNINQFKEIYKTEMHNTLDLLEERKSQLSFSSQLFGFSSHLPKELAKEQKEAAGKSNNNHRLVEEVREALLEIEDIVFTQRLGTPRSTVERDEWRKALRETGDTTQFCVDQCIPVLHAADPGMFLYTPEELGAPEKINSAQKLTIALLQIVHGIRDDCFHSPFFSETKKNGQPVRRPTAAFVEWQLALKQCKSASAVALFETTFEYAVNWEYVVHVEQQQEQKQSKVGRRRNPKAAPSSTANSSIENGPPADEPGPSTSTNAQKVAAQKKLERLLASATGLLVSGTRQRKPVTKYGECEMDLDKLDLDDEADLIKVGGRRHKSSDNDSEAYSGEEANGQEDDDEDEQEDDEDSDGIRVRPRRNLRSRQQDYDGLDFDGFGALRYEGLGRKRKAVTHFDPTNYHGQVRKRKAANKGEEAEDEAMESEHDDEDGSAADLEEHGNEEEEDQMVEAAQPHHGILY